MEDDEQWLYGEGTYLQMHEVRNKLYQQIVFVVEPSEELGNPVVALEGPGHDDPSTT